MMVRHSGKHNFLDTRAKIFITGFIASVAFIILTSINLTAQGLYYDEVHQVPAAFAYTGQSPSMFNRLDMYGIPILNMSYSGAIKSNIYGLYLKYLGSHFTIWSWRSLDIGFVAIGIFIFSVIVSRSIPVSTSLIFLLFLLTDVSITLTSRHDWGPTALALSIRLLFIAVWITRELNQKSLARKNFILGALVGIAIFEKLSSVVLVLPLFLILWLTVQKNSIRNWFAGLLGMFIGSIPLMIVNIWSYVNGKGLISLEITSDPETSVSSSLSLFQFGYNYLSLGQGKIIRHWILGQPAGRLSSSIEAAAIICICLFIISVSIRFRRTNRFLQMSGVMVACYFAVGMGLFLLPRTTWIHHWIIGTPFQYAAITLALAGLSQQMSVPKHNQKLFQKLFTTMPVVSSRVSGLRIKMRRAGIPLNPQGLRHIFVGAVITILLLHLRSTISVELALVAGESSSAYDPSFSKVAQFATGKIGTAIFIAADWGTATQIYSLSNGQPDLVYQPFSDTGDNKDVKVIIKQTDRTVLYLITRRKGRPIFPKKTDNIISEIEQSDFWQEVAVEAEVGRLNSVAVRKFVRSAQSGGGNRVSAGYAVNRVTSTYH